MLFVLYGNSEALKIYLKLEQMIVQHVFPEFRSQAGHLRAKDAWVAGQCAGINFADQGNFSIALHSVVTGLRDPDAVSTYRFCICS